MSVKLTSSDPTNDQPESARDNCLQKNISCYYASFVQWDSLYSLCNRSGGTCASRGAGAAGPRKTVVSARFGGEVATTGRNEETPGGATPLLTTPPERLLHCSLAILHNTSYAVTHHHLGFAFGEKWEPKERIFHTAAGEKSMGCKLPGTLYK